MNNETKKQIQTLAQEWLQNGEGYTQAELSRKTGIDKAYMSQIMNKKWTESIPSVVNWQKLAYFFGHEQHIETANYLNIYHACQHAQAHQGRIGVDGYTGAGKTYSLERYANKQPNVFVISCRRSMGVKSFVRAIAEKVGVGRMHGQVYDYERAIVQRIERLEKPLLIFDECEYLSPAALDSIKSLIQDLRGKCGVVVCGIIKQWLEKMATRGRHGMPQLLRRIGHSWLEMQPIQAREVRGFCKANGINHVPAINFFVSRVSNYDTLQIMVKDVVRVSERQRIPITADLCAQLFMN